MRKLMLFVALGVLAWIFVVPSCSTKFGCESAPATAHADSGSCPSNLEGAAHDRAWADERIASLPERGRGDPTHGLLYDSGGTEHPLVSGESGDEYEAGKDILGNSQAAGHVEAKAGAVVRSADDENFAVLVINNEPCTYALDVGCRRVAAMVLPSGSTMVIWSPSGRVEVRGSA